MFITKIVAGALLASCPAHAQRARGDYRIGYLSITSATNGLRNLEALRAGLRTLGYIEGQNIAIEARWADGHIENLPRLAAELVRLPVDILCTAGTQASGVAKQATATVPIVFANAAFPVQTGLVASYPRPGGNITGIAFLDAEYGKRLELLKQIYPKLARVALIYNADNPASVAAFQETQRWATALGIGLEPHRFRRLSDFERVFSAIAAKRPDALMTTADALIISYRTRLLDFTATHRLLSMYPTREFVVEGGLMFYGTSIPAMFRQVAVYVDKILKGAKPADLPVEQATKFEFVLNTKTAKTLGLAIPQSLLLRVDEIVE